MPDRVVGGPEGAARGGVLVAAERVFARRGLSAALEDVALFEAVFDRKLDPGIDLLRTCLRRPSAWDGLCEFLLKGLGQDTDPIAVPAPPDDDVFGEWLAAQR